MDLIVSLKAENGLFNFLYKKIKKQILSTAMRRHMVPYDGATTHHMAPLALGYNLRYSTVFERLFKKNSIKK
jgi:hypothetical protein